MKFKGLFLLFAIFSCHASAQFQGHGGIYFLGAADIPVSVNSFSSPLISGVVCRFRWENLEPSPGIFDWSFIDGEISKANTAGKKISLQPLGIPQWIADSLHAQEYYYIDENPSHPTYGQVISSVLPWDSIYIDRIKILLQELATRYAADTTISYVNAIGVQVSRNLPDTIVTDTTLHTLQPFWQAFNYQADSLALVINDLVNYYMTIFPSTPLWCSVDYVKFEYNASARPVNYLATLYTGYGLANYPDRFGLFREDLSGCNPPPVINSGSHWYIMQQHPCATGAQMLWNVQDGPDRMNQCNMLPNTKSFVLDSAIHHGFSLGMQYMEIYGADIDDTSLTSTLSSAGNDLNDLSTACQQTMDITSPDERREIFIYPNPASGIIHIDISDRKDSWFTISDITGSVIGKFQTEIFNAALLQPGIYFIRIGDDNYSSTEKLIVIR